MNESNREELKSRIKQDSHKQNLSNFFIEKIFLICGVLTIVFLGLIVWFLISKSWPAISEIGLREFLTKTRWMPSSPIQAGYGALSFIVSSILVTVGALIIGVPWGIFTAIFIAEVAPTRIKEVLKPVVEILGIIPSVVYGFIALLIIAPKVAQLFGLSNGLTALTGSVILAVMTLPTIVSITEDAIKSVPKDYREASYALGVGKWDTIIHVVLPAASSGILAAVMLGFGRAVGETMAVLMAAGNALNMPIKEIFNIPLPTLLQSVRTLTANIAIEGSDVPWGSLHYHSLFVVGLILFVITFIVNIIADLMLTKFQKVNKNG